MDRKVFIQDSRLYHPVDVHHNPEVANGVILNGRVGLVFFSCGGNREVIVA
jgi:hypothetical protein